MNTQKQRAERLITFLLCGFAAAATASAGTLGSFSTSLSSNPGGRVEDNGLEIQFTIGNGCLQSIAPCYTIFDQIVTASDVGTTFLIDVNTQPGFSGAAGLLTNGQADTLLREGFSVHGGGGGNGGPESLLFSLPNGVVDFAGNTITDIRVTLNSLQFDNFNGGFWFSTETLAVDGQAGSSTPEPVTWLLTASAAGALIMLRKIRRSRSS